jgi:hypothetical protein
LSLLDFPFLGAAFASQNAAEGGDEGGKIQSFLGEPERSKVLYFASESAYGFNAKRRISAEVAKTNIG